MGASDADIPSLRRDDRCSHIPLYRCHLYRCHKGDRLAFNTSMLDAREFGEARGPLRMKSAGDKQ